VPFVGFSGNQAGRERQGAHSGNQWRALPLPARQVTAEIQAA
jgi:hypothetical protein